jgi:AcrR family transcriptional regulator
MTSPGLRAPQQQRSRDSLQRLLSAGAEILADDGYEALTIAQLRRRAGISSGLIYSRFDGKDALFAAIHERELARLAAENAAMFDAVAWDDLDFAELVGTAVGLVAEQFRRNEPLLRVFMTRSVADPATRERGSRSVTELSGAFESVLLARRAEIASRDPALAVDMCFRLAFTTVGWRVLHGPTFESSLLLSWDRLQAELATVCLAYLGHAADQ